MPGIWVAAFPQASQGPSYDLQDGLGGLVARNPPCIQALSWLCNLLHRKLSDKNSHVDWFILPCTGTPSPCSPRTTMECLGLRHAFSILACWSE